MPNFATQLKQEIARLARKELRKELEGLKKASTQYRSEIAALKRSVAALEKQLARSGRQAARQAKPEADAETGAGLRFSAKGLASQRKRLALSAAEFGRLLGVSAQTVYNWETRKTRPQASQLPAIASVKRMGKKQARALLADPAE
ncbi:MAG: helix-turn-helix transcriptional regulator [Holophagaceae bacterium]|nr:helix-turn-helix transcriptional regulator [Holophagaceae bacterium]